jgi:hypothetical protein
MFYLYKKELHILSAVLKMVFEREYIIAKCPKQVLTNVTVRGGSTGSLTVS